MTESRFVHLHVHSEYSLLNGVCRLKPLIEKAASLNMKHLALTDHGVMHGVLEFYKLAKGAGIHPIIGVDANIAPGSRHDKTKKEGEYNSYPLVLLAKNMQGYENLMRLSSIAQLEGFYYVPRMDKEILSQYCEGLIALSGSIRGEVPSLIRRGQMNDAKQCALDYLSMFGEGNFYLEALTKGYTDQESTNQALRELSKETSIPLVAAVDVHYLVPEDSKTQDVLFCIGNKKTLDDSNRFQSRTDQLYLKSEDEIRAEMPDYEDAIDRTVEIAEQCTLELKYDSSKLIMPNFEIPKDGGTKEEYLRSLVYKGAKERYGEVTEALTVRIESELDIILGSDFTGYFLIVWDYIKFARENGISVGPGRGSAAGSVVAFCLYITDIEPIQYGLLFERFLNPERISPPDIDTDFSDQRRDEVIRYTQEKYGKDRVAQIATFGTIGAKNAVRDVARVMGMPPSEGDRIAKLIPEGLGVTLTGALNDVPELQRIRDADESYQELFRLALSIEGLVRNTSTHAAGIIIAPDELCHFTPLMRGANKEEDVATQFEMKSLETIGLLKMDFLGLKNLSVIDGAVDVIRQTDKPDFAIDAIPMDDEKTFELLGQGKTNGVFQLESTGMKELLRKMKPNSFSDIIALIALYRPGPLGSGMVDDFIRRKRGEEEIVYDHPTLEPILKETYGIILYQEQVMQIANVIAGFTLGQADMMRRAMGKKNVDILNAMEHDFYEGAKQKEVKIEIAKKLWNLIFQFAGYGFNKSHSAAYAVITYRTAYLKANYPAAFLASLLTTDMNDTNKIVKYMTDAKDFGIDVLPPDVNESLEYFSVTDEGIRFGLAAIKSIGSGAIGEIIRERKVKGRFKSLSDFCNRAKAGVLSKSLIETLIRAGTFDEFGYNRATLLHAYPTAFERAQGMLKDQAIGQESLFGSFDEDDSSQDDFIVELPELPKMEIAKSEKTLLGFHLTCHPLDDYQLETNAFAQNRIRDIMDLIESGGEKYVRLFGIATKVKKKKIKSGDRIGLFLLDDGTGEIEAAVMPGLLEEVSEKLLEEALLIVEGSASARGDELSVRAERIVTIDEGWKEYVREMHVSVPGEFMDKDRVSRLQSELNAHQGTVPVVMHFNVPDVGVVDYALDAHTVTASRELKMAVEVIFDCCEMEFKSYTSKPRENTKRRYGNNRTNGNGSR